MERSVSSSKRLETMDEAWQSGYSNTDKDNKAKRRVSASMFLLVICIAFVQ